MDDDRLAAKLALVERQRRFEWTLARDAQAKAAAALLKGRTHQLLNLIQIVELASVELERRSTGEALDIVRDLVRTADRAKRELAEIVALAKPPERARGPSVAASVQAAIDAVRVVASELVVTLRLDVDSATALTDEELQQLVFGLVLDAAAGAGSVELLVRQRRIESAPWVEFVCGFDCDAGELRVIRAIVERATGELTVSPRRGGGSEVVVALPVV
jgi:hypothetical protein